MSVHLSATVFPNVGETDCRMHPTGITVLAVGGTTYTGRLSIQFDNAEEARRWLDWCSNLLVREAARFEMVTSLMAVEVTA